MAHFLRDGPEAVAHLDERDLRASLAAAARAGDVSEELRLVGLLGEMERVGGRDARRTFERALDLAHAIVDTGAVHLNSIRHATASFYMGDYAIAEVELRRTIQQMSAEGHEKYLHFAYQHLGKCLAEQDRFSKAIECFQQALERRTDSNLRASSQRAIEAATAAAAG